MKEEERWEKMERNGVKLGRGEGRGKIRREIGRNRGKRVKREGRKRAGNEVRN